jgi:hypothetical protein
VAIKFKSLSARELYVEELPLEVNLLSSLSHPLIIGFKDFFSCPQYNILVLERFGTSWGPGTLDKTSYRKSKIPGPTNLAAYLGIFYLYLASRSSCFVRR